MCSSQLLNITKLYTNAKLRSYETQKRVSYEVQPTSNQRHAPNVFLRERDIKILEGNKIHDIMGELFVEWCA
jgi:hypothetical protein